MSESKPRTRRTTEQIVADLESKIDYHKKCINSLEAQKKLALTPKERQRKTSMKQVVEAMKAADLEPEEVLKMISKAANKK